MTRKIIAVLVTSVLLSGCALKEKQETERLRINKEFSSFRECTAWSAKVLGDGATPEEHLELTNSCLIMKRKDGHE